MCTIFKPPNIGIIFFCKCAQKMWKKATKSDTHDALFLCIERCLCLADQAEGSVLACQIFFEAGLESPNISPDPRAGYPEKSQLYTSPNMRQPLRT